jgi:tetratricopeptide (TPR) repeat protein
LNRVHCLLIVALCAAAAAVSAQDLRVEYLDGQLEVQSGGRWRQARAGDAIAGTASVRLSEGALAELSAGELRVTLHQPGTYAVGALLRTSRQSLAWGLGRLLKTRIRALFSSPSGGSESSGARAWEAKDPLTDLEMMEDEEEEARKAAERAEQATAEEVQALLAGGRAGEAAAAAGRALERASAAGRPYFLFLLASARCLEGSYAEALRALEPAAVPEEAPYYGEYALLKARLLLEGQAYREALALFDQLLADSPGPSASQQAWFLSAFCSLQLGDRTQARRRLEKARDLDPAAEIGMNAKELLNNL